MPVQTLSALVLKGGYNAETRKHPLWDYMEKVTNWFDDANHDLSEMAEFYTEDFSFRTPHTDHLESTGYGDDHIFKRAAEQIYTEPMESFRHENGILMAFETEDGYDVYSHQAIFGNVAGKPAAGEEKVKDENGKEWDIEVPVSYHFDVKKVADAKHSGFKLRHITAIKDTGVINDTYQGRMLTIVQSGRSWSRAQEKR